MADSHSPLVLPAPPPPPPAALVADHGRALSVASDGSALTLRLSAAAVEQVSELKEVNVDDLTREVRPLSPSCPRSASPLLVADALGPPLADLRPLDARHLPLERPLDPPRPARQPHRLGPARDPLFPRRPAHLDHRARPRARRRPPRHTAQHVATPRAPRGARAARGRRRARGRAAHAQRGPPHGAGGRAARREGREDGGVGRGGCAGERQEAPRGEGPGGECWVGRGAGARGGQERVHRGAEEGRRAGCASRSLIPSTVLGEPMLTRCC